MRIQTNLYVCACGLEPHMVYIYTRFKPGLISWNLPHPSDRESGPRNKSWCTRTYMHACIRFIPLRMVCQKTTYLNTHILNIYIKSHTLTQKSEVTCQIRSERRNRTSCMYVCIYIHTHLHRCIRTICVRRTVESTVRTRTWTFAHIFMYVCMYVYTDIFTYIFTYDSYHYEIACQCQNIHIHKYIWLIPVRRTVKSPVKTSIWTSEQAIPYAK